MRSRPHGRLELERQARAVVGAARDPYSGNDLVAEAWSDSVALVLGDPEVANAGQASQAMAPPEQGHHVYLGIVTSLRVQSDQEISAFPGGVFGSAHDLGEEGDGEVGNQNAESVGYDWSAGFGR